MPISTTTGNQARIYNNLGTALVYTEVTGFFVPAGQGSLYVATAPTRLLALRPLGATAELTRTTRAIPRHDDRSSREHHRCRLHPDQLRHVSVCPGGTVVATRRLSSTVNPYAGQDTAAGTLTGLGSGPALTYCNNAGSGLLFTDIQRYFTAS